MVPLSHNTIKLICQLIFQQIEWKSSDCNSDDIRLLDNLMAKYDNLKKLMMMNINEQTALFDVKTIDQLSQMKNILNLLDKLCALPIHGIHIRQYLEKLEKYQRNKVEQKENVVKLPASAQSSSLMQKLRAIMDQN